MRPSGVQEPLSVGFGREYVRGWSSNDAAWLIEASQATMAERMCAISPLEAERWVRSAEIAVSQRIAQALRDHEVLVLVSRVSGPALCDVMPAPVKLADLAPQEVVELVEELVDFIEVQLVDPRGTPRASVRYVLQLPDGTEVRGTTDADGMLRHEDLGQQGESLLLLPDLEVGAVA